MLSSCQDVAFDVPMCPRLGGSGLITNHKELIKRSDSLIVCMYKCHSIKVSGLLSLPNNLVEYGI